MQVALADAGGRAGAWSALAAVLVWPGRALGNVVERRYVLVPYVVATLLAVAVALVVPVAETVQVTGGGPAAAIPGGRNVRPVVPVPGATETRSTAEMLQVLAPTVQKVAAVALPWWSGFWRASVLLLVAGLAGQTPGFRRTFGVVGYSLVPLWLGDLLRGGLILISGDAAGGQRIRWTLDVLWPSAQGLWARALGAMDVFQLWHLVLLVIGFALLTRRRPWQVAWVGLLVFALPPLLKFSLPYLARWFGDTGAGAGPFGTGNPGGPSGPGGPPGGSGGPGPGEVRIMPPSTTLPAVPMPARPMPIK